MMASWERMKNTGCLLGPSSTRFAIQILAATGDAQNAQVLFDSVDEEALTFEIFATLASAYAEAGDVARVLELRREMRQRGLIGPGTGRQAAHEDGTNVVMKAARRRMQEAPPRAYREAREELTRVISAVVEDARRRGPVTVGLYSMAIAWSATAQEAESYLEQARGGFTQSPAVQEASSEVKRLPRALLGPALQACVTAGDGKAADRFLTMFSAEGCTIGPEALGLATHAYAKEGDLDAAVSSFRRFLTSNFEPTELVLSGVVKAAQRAAGVHPRAVGVAEAAFAVAVNRGLARESKTWRGMMGVYAAVGNAEKA
eukprot:Hpha_TRINITY_DN19885_c0_g1::TRINITY_DN19885_c0_g1_i1::g.132077::m.132077